MTDIHTNLLVQAKLGRLFVTSLIAYTCVYKSVFYTFSVTHADAWGTHYGLWITTEI